MSRHRPPGLTLALDLAAHSWHIFPLTPHDKRPLGNCKACNPNMARLTHEVEDCPCLPAGRWCHGVRAATTDPARLAAWWAKEPRAVPGVAAGPSGLCLIDIDTDHEELPEDLATGLLPGIDLRAEPVPPKAWNDRARFRNGRDSLSLLARLRGRINPWPKGSQNTPLVAATPSGGRHLWYRTPAPNLHQAIAKTTGTTPRGLAWQVDIKAGWSYGIAPGAQTARGAYIPMMGSPASVGAMPEWLAEEVIRVASRRPPTAAPHPRPAQQATRPVDRARAYIDAVLADRLPQIEGLHEGRPTALAALAYRIGGHLAATGIDEGDIPQRLIDAGVAAGLSHRIATRTVNRSLSNGRSRPMEIPASRHRG